MLPDSNGISPVPPYLRINASVCFCFAYGAITLSGRSFQNRSATKTSIRPRSTESVYLATPQPKLGFRLFRVRSPLLAESLLFSLPPGTKMFQFPGCASPSYEFRCVIPLSKQGRVVPFGYPRIKACLAAPRGFSQPATSFIAFQSQGIHHAHYNRLCLTFVGPKPSVSCETETLDRRLPAGTFLSDRHALPTLLP